jgi:serine/threonine protein kinase
MLKQLRVVNGPQAGAVFPLVATQAMSVGRAADCVIRLADPAASRLHCRIEFEGPRTILRDAGSRWGTTVNGETIDAHELQPGDVIAIGETELRYESEASPIAATMAPVRPAVAQPGAAPAVSRAVRPASPAEIAKLAGRKILRFEIQAIVAQARTGMVFRARDVEQNRDVAFKVFYPTMFLNEAAVERFLRAAKTMLAIRHENLVTLYMAGRREGFCFTACEFVEGESAAQLIERVGIGGMLSWEQALKIAVQIAQALAVAEKHKIVHRNVTPRNILIRHSDKAAKLGDLIFAKALEGVNAVQVTRPGELVGELAYMSPEQTTGEGNIDCRSDIYGLGATLYAVLTGRPPLEGRNAAETILKIQTQEPEKPSKFHLAIPPLFEGVVLRMLTKRPEGRHRSARELLADLARVAKYQGLSLPL